MINSIIDWSIGGPGDTLLGLGAAFRYGPNVLSGAVFLHNMPECGPSRRPFQTETDLVLEEV
jgi:hypothetical protein